MGEKIFICDMRLSSDREQKEASVNIKHTFINNVILCQVHHNVVDILQPAFLKHNDVRCL